MKIKAGFLLLLLFLPTGCLNREPRPDENVRWQDEVILAQDCGMDKLRCCPDREPPCFYDQICCPDPNDLERNYCADECTYGGEKEFCRAEEVKCDNGLVCYRGYCVKCGGGQEPCCDDRICNSDLMCYEERCVQCGLANNPCCNEGLACLNQVSIDNNRTECRDGICIKCGTSGYKTCWGEPKCNLGHLLNNDNCLQCGGYNQPCCNEESGNGYDCNPDLGLKCQLGFCSKK
jgi:hypothetical protein